MSTDRPRRSGVCGVFCPASGVKINKAVGLDSESFECRLLADPLAARALFSQHRGAYCTVRAAQLGMSELNMRWRMYVTS